MADYRAISNGNYSNLAIWEVWDGSAWVAATVLPQVGDDVYANGRTVTIDIDSFASSYRTTGISGVAASGGFVLNGGITAVGDVRSGQTRCMTHSAASDSFVIGDSYGSSPQPTNGGVDGIRGSGAGTVHLVGSSRNGTGTANNQINSPAGIRGTSSGSFIVYGDAIAVNNVNQQGVSAFAQGSQGKVLGAAIGVNSGNVRGAWNCEVNELDGLNQNCIVTGKIIFRTGGNKLKAGANVLVEVFSDENDQPVLCNPLFAQDQADQSDVRLGTIYANGALTGTLAVPPAGAVSLGVPVDNTVGTQPTAAVVAADLLTEMETSNLPIAVRMRNTATDAFVTAAVAAITPAP